MAVTGIFRATHCRLVASARHLSSVVGIDLGTANSRVAVLEDKGPKIVKYSEKLSPKKLSPKDKSVKWFPYTPSVVTVTPKNEVLVGRTPYSLTTSDPFNTLLRFKHLMGRKFLDDHVAKERNSMLFDIVEGPNGDAMIEVNKIVYSPSQLQGFLIRRMTEIAGSFLGKCVTRAVIAVPACFNDDQRRATTDACRFAGLEELALIDEPITVALCHGIRNEERPVAILDFGETFKFTILKISNGDYKVITKTDNLFVGGLKFDVAVVKWLLKFKTAGDVPKGPFILQRLLDAASFAKETISSKLETQIKLRSLVKCEKRKGYETKNLLVELTRAEFDTVVKGFIEEIDADCKACLKAANINISDVGKIILTGGLSNLPIVQNLVKDIFGRSPSMGKHPDGEVVRGAAIASGVVGVDWIEWIKT